MSVLIETIDALEYKLQKLLQKMQHLQQTNEMLRIAIQDKNREINALKLLVQKKDQEFEALNLANSILGGNDSKQEAKQKISSLIKEIDDCIAYLSK